MAGQPAAGDTQPGKQLLRIATAGSVDDGKSTLIGRLLYDSKLILADQLASVERTSERRGAEQTDLALLTDGLRSEREQGITIDVSYRYFATSRRKFIIADTPGHAQYTRNMVTGASTADAALILVDARNGVLEQTRRHAFISALLGIPRLVVCVNKMDLVGWSRERFDGICEDFRVFAMKLDIADIAFIPVSALHGDNIVDLSEHNSPWYDGPPLLRHLERIEAASDRNLIDARLPVQYVIRPQRQSDAALHDHRAYAGTVAGGVFKPGDEVVALPSGITSTVRSVWGPGGREMAEAFAGCAVSVSLADDLDIARGDMLCRPGNRPHVGRGVDAMVCWLTDASRLRAGGRYLVRHSTAQTQGVVDALDYRLDVNTLHRVTDAADLGLNDIGRIRLHTRAPLLFDAYGRNRATGGFVLIDEASGDTVAAGMITGPARTESSVVWHSGAVRRVDRPTRGATVWLTGLSASGKSSIAVELERLLTLEGRPVYRLDGDNLRHGLNSDLAFSPEDRAENVRRVGEVARMFADAGVVAIASLISPYRADRDAIRARHVDDGLAFAEVFVDTPLELCERRDPKGMYARARAGEITGFTGIDAPYEAPLHPELLLRPEDGTAVDLARIIRERLDR